MNDRKSPETILEQALRVRAQLLKNIEEAEMFYSALDYDDPFREACTTSIQSNKAAIEAMEFIAKEEAEPEAPLAVQGYVTRFLNRLRSKS